MRARILARLSATVLVGLIWAMIWWRVALVRHAHGKEAFLAAEARRFDKFYAHPLADFARPEFVVKEVVTTIIAMGTLIVVYESLAFGIYKIIRLIKPSCDAPEKT